MGEGEGGGLSSAHEVKEAEWVGREGGSSVPPISTENVVLVVGHKSLLAASEAWRGGEGGAEDVVVEMAKKEALAAGWDWRG